MRCRRLGLLLVYAALLVGGLAAGHWLTELTAFDLRPSTEARVHAMVMTTTAIYIVAAAIPFVPGAEIGFALILALGDRIVILVYASMIAALLISYGIGRFVPARAIIALFDFLGLIRARDLVRRLEPLGVDQRMRILTENAPRRVIPFLCRHRFIALAILINLPGNSLIGGGGGLAMAAGMTGVYPFGRFLATIAVAVAPLPAIILLTGYGP